MKKSNPNLTSLYLTHVQYKTNDKIGEILSYITLLPLVILIGYATTIINRREISTLIALFGQLSNEVLNMILKNLFKEERPNSFKIFVYNLFRFGLWIWYAI